jgi:hypothetical protein
MKINDPTYCTTVVDYYRVMTDRGGGDREMKRGGAPATADASRPEIILTP